jgi:cell division protease FtsH
MPDKHCSLPSSLLCWLLASIGIILVMTSMWDTPGSVRYSDFKAWLRQGRVERVQIGPHTLQGTLRPAADATGVAALPQRFMSVRVEDPALLRDLEAHGVPYRGYDESALGAILLGGMLPLGVGLMLWVWMSSRMGPGQGVMELSQSRARMATEHATEVTFADVADAAEAKEELQELVDFLRQPGKYTELGGRIPTGVLLVGPPGTGKTLLARAVAGEAQVPFFRLNGSDFVEMFVGVGAARVRDLFRQAQEQAPCIVFIDELDAVGKARSTSPIHHNDEREQTLNQLLTEMDGFNSRPGIIILAATNRPEVLDAALLRAGRFDRHVVVGRPDIQGRLRILQIHARQVRLSPDVDLQVMAARTPGLVGADLATIMNEAALLAARRNKQAVGMAELDAAVDRLLAGPERHSRVVAPAEKQRVAYHECGHALVAEALPTTDPVRKVTIIPHGVAALGYTQQLPSQERYLYTREELLERITVMLGGRAAEEVMLQDISTGAQDDLQRASDLARRMVTTLGMSARLGPYAVEPGQQFLFLEAYEPVAKGYSDVTAEHIDHEAQAIVAQRYRRAVHIIVEHRQLLEALAQYLLQHEVIDQQALAILCKGLRTEVQGGLRTEC